MESQVERTLMKMNKWIGLGQLVASLAISSWAIGTARAQITVENLPFTKSSGTMDGCPGAYTGLVKMTNSAGVQPLTLITPPANATNGTLTDISSLGSNYVSVAYVVRYSDFNPWCGSNNVTFPVSNGDQFYLNVYVRNCVPAVTNGQSISAQIKWLP